MLPVGALTPGVFVAGERGTTSVERVGLLAVGELLAGEGGAVAGERGAMNVERVGLLAVGAFVVGAAGAV